MHLMPRQHRDEPCRRVSEAVGSSGFQECLSLWRAWSGLHMAGAVIGFLLSLVVLGMGQAQARQQYRQLRQTQSQLAQAEARYAWPEERGHGRSHVTPPPPPGLPCCAGNSSTRCPATSCARWRSPRLRSLKTFATRCGHERSWFEEEDVHGSVGA